MNALLLLEDSGLIDLPCTKDDLYLRVLERAERLYTLRQGGFFRSDFPQLCL